MMAYLNCLSKLPHPASYWRFTKAFKTAPGYDLIEDECLRLHHSVQAASALTLQRLEELQDCLSGEHDSRASDCIVKLLAQCLSLEAVRFRSLRFGQILQVLHREPDPMRCHCINVIVLAKYLV